MDSPRCPECRAITTVEEDDLGRHVCCACNLVFTHPAEEPEERERRDLE